MAPVNQKNSDSSLDLLTLMTRRLHKVENELIKTKRELKVSEQREKAKDNQIHALQQQLSTLESLKEIQKDKTTRISPSFEYLQDIMLKYKQLEEQVNDMEAFLSDYGLVWVGNENACAVIEHQQQQQQSIGAPLRTIDFHKLLANISELNVIAGEGEPQICHTPNGAIFKVSDNVPLTLYSDGMILFSGPFREYSDARTQSFLQDILDGYFPSELQRAYPNGVPFQVTDKHTVPYLNSRNKFKVFGGEGFRLGNKYSNNTHSSGQDIQDKCKYAERISENATGNIKLKTNKNTSTDIIQTCDVQHGNELNSDKKLYNSEYNSASHNNDVSEKTCHKNLQFSNTSSFFSSNSSVSDSDSKSEVSTSTMSSNVEKCSVKHQVHDSGVFSESNQSQQEERKFMHISNISSNEYLKRCMNSKDNKCQINSVSLSGICSANKYQPLEPVIRPTDKNIKIQENFPRSKWTCSPLVPLSQREMNHLDSFMSTPTLPKSLPKLKTERNKCLWNMKEQMSTGQRGECLHNFPNPSSGFNIGGMFGIVERLYKENNLKKENEKTLKMKTSDGIISHKICKRGNCDGSKPDHINSKNDEGNGKEMYTNIDFHSICDRQEVKKPFHESAIYTNYGFDPSSSTSLILYSNLPTEKTSTYRDIENSCTSETCSLQADDNEGDVEPSQKMISDGGIEIIMESSFNGLKKSSNIPNYVENMKSSKDNGKTKAKFGNNIEKFLHKLPTFTKRDGKLMSMRQNVEEFVQNAKEDGPKVLRVKAKQTCSKEKLISLKVRSLDGNINVMVDLSTETKVQELYSILEKVLKCSLDNCELTARCASLPNMLLNNYSNTLEEYGLTVNSVLCIERKEKSQP